MIKEEYAALFSGGSMLLYVSWIEKPHTLRFAASNALLVSDPLLVAIKAVPGVETVIIRPSEITLDIKILPVRHRSRRELALFIQAISKLYAQRCNVETEDVEVVFANVAAGYRYPTFDSWMNG